jgi:hypothetical protein
LCYRTRRKKERKKEIRFFLFLFSFDFIFISFYFIWRSQGGRCMERRKMRLYRTPVLGSLAPRTVVAYTHLHTHTHTCTYIYIYLCVCVCVVYICAWAGTRRLSRRSGGSALRAVTASAGNGQEKYGGDQMVAALQ